MIDRPKRKLHDYAAAAGARALGASRHPSARDALTKLARHFNLDLSVPFGKLPRKRRELLLYGPDGGGRAQHRLGICIKGRAHAVAW